MTTIIVITVMVFGVNTLFWGTAGALRSVAAYVRRRRPAAHRPVSGAVSADEVAVLIAAHNEELVIDDMLVAVAGLVDPAQVHVISDGSTDRTAALARSAGVNVLELAPNRGKAGALAAGIEHFHLDRHFEVVLLLDADTHLAPDYFSTGLPLFDDPTVMAVAGRAATLVDPPPPDRLGRFLIAYRERFYVAVQWLLKYGQAARPANVVPIVPGFASMYRSCILPEIDVAAPGLVIEDFNMTFELHAKRLGRIAFHPRAAIAYTQDPDTLHDYVNQMRRWMLGFWQTLRRHRLHPGKFGAATAVYILELLTSSIMLVMLVPAIVLSLAAELVNRFAHVEWNAITAVSDVLPPEALALGVLLPDYLLTVLIATVCRRPMYLLLGIGFPLMRILDAALCLRTLPQAFLSRSDGTWCSPDRRASSAPPSNENAREIPAEQLGN